MLFPFVSWRYTISTIFKFMDNIKINKIHEKKKTNDEY